MAQGYGSRSQATVPVAEELASDNGRPKSALRSRPFLCCVVAHPDEELILAGLAGRESLEHVRDLILVFDEVDSVQFQED